MTIAYLHVARNRVQSWLRRPSMRSAPRHTLVRWNDWLFRCRVLWILLLYLALISLANYLAFWLRFDGTIPPEEAQHYVRMLPVLIAISGIAFIQFGLYRGSWRYTSIWDLRNLVGAVSISAIGFYALTHFVVGLTAYPRSVIIIGAFLSISLIGGVRLAWRIVNEILLPKRDNRVLIIGAGDAGEMIARDLKKKGDQPVGFIDDDPLKVGQSIHNIRVLGGREDLTRILATHTPDEVLIAMPSADPSTIRRFVSALEHCKVPITTLPSLREIVDCKVSASQVRRVAVEDLLPRLPVHLDQERARDLVEGRRVLITGAGGSIGSELCRQVAALDPDRLILFERYENNLYTALNTLPRTFRIKPRVGDVTDRRRLHAVMREHRPDIIFHAAAHKHVPLMELNPCEAVKNNVIGTRTVAEAAEQFAVGKFILISTDKAVNPTSLMGATKRAAELVVQSMACRPGLRWATVRFGNVLGSNGSVIPRWLEQIAAGGPVTVTHPEVRRYFMLIPEAVQLILQAAAVSRGGEIFALEMGEQINLMKIARELIRLSGFIPDDEIQIAVVGLRPGEKLSEELVGPDESRQCSPVDKVLLLRTLAPPDAAHLMSQVTELGSLAVRGDAPGVVHMLRAIVPTFQPDPALNRAAEESRIVTSRGTLRKTRSGTRSQLVVPCAAVSADPVTLQSAGGNGHTNGNGNGHGHGTHIAAQGNGNAHGDSDGHPLMRLGDIENAGLGPMEVIAAPQQSSGRPDPIEHPGTNARWFKQVTS